MTRNAWGHGLATTTLEGGTTLDVWYPDPRLGAPSSDDGALTDLERVDDVRGVRSVAVTTVVDLDAPPGDPADAYLRLHLLSHRLVQPHGLNLDGIFGVLENVVWTDVGPCSPVGFEATRARVRAATGRFPVVHGVDKFPRMVDYVVPSGVRVADGARVRLGAHLAEGTTVMHEGFVNYNAGTLGASMVEGRISAGVVVDAGSDIGGGASIMGTLSGGGTTVNSVGARSLLGANAGLGFPLGDDCVVEAGLYVTAGTKVVLSDPSLREELDAAPGPEGAVVVKARDLAGRPGLLFRRNSTTGAVEVLRRAGSVDLNPDLHAN